MVQAVGVGSRVQYLVECLVHPEVQSWPPWVAYFPWACYSQVWQLVFP